MRTQAQIEASRKNGASSKGPKTAQGRARSSQNAFRHGLAAHKFVVLDGESTADWDMFYDAYLVRFQPSDLVEETLVLEMAVNQWRLARAWALQTSVIDQGSIEQQPLVDQKFATYDNFLIHSHSYASRARELAILDQYETRLSRNFERALKKLNQIRQQHPAPPVLENEPGDALPPVQPAESAAAGPAAPEQNEAKGQAGPVPRNANPENEPGHPSSESSARSRELQVTPSVSTRRPIAAIIVLCLLPFLSALTKLSEIRI